MFRRFMKKALLFLAAIFILNTAGIYYRWYLDYFWFDIANHFLGGFFVAMFFYDFLKSDLQKLEKLKIFLVLVSITALTGVLWELSEYLSFVFLTDLIYQKYSYRVDFIGDLADTLDDLFNDIVGALAYSVILFRSHFFRRGDS